MAIEPPHAQIHVHCVPKRREREQTRTMCRLSAGGLIPSAVKTSALILTVSLYLLSDLANCSSASVQASDVAQATLGTYNLKELEEVVYSIEIRTVPLPEPPVPSGAESSQTEVKSANDYKESESVPDSSGAGGREEMENKHSEEAHQLKLLSKYGQKYVCTLPQDVASVVPAVSDSEENKEDEFINMTALLRPLTKRSCLTKSTGWWTYEYCHGDYIRQYHSEASQTVKNIWIGRYQNETIWDRDEIKRTEEQIKSLRGKAYDFRVYHSVQYVNGTTCDLTGKPRRATVKLYCSLSGEDRLVSIQEKETCDYVFIVETPLLCSLPLFDVKSMKKPRNLSCSPVISQEEYVQYMERQERKKKEEEQRLKEERERAAAEKANEATKHDETKWLKKLRSNLFDSGVEENGEGEVDENIEEDLSDVADKFDAEVLSEVMDSLDVQLSELAKDKDNLFKMALQHAIKNTQKTVTKLMESKEKRSAGTKSSQSDGTRKDGKDSFTFKQMLKGEKVHSEDDGVSQESKYKKLDRIHIRSDGQTTDREGSRDSKEKIEDERVHFSIKGRWKRPSQPSQSEAESDEDDIVVEDEDDEEEGWRRRLSDRFTKKTGDSQSGNSDTNPEVRIKVYTVPSDMLEDLFDEGEDIDLDEVVGRFNRDREELDEDGEGEEELDAFGKSKASASEVPQQKLSRDYPAGTGARTSSGNDRGGGGGVGSGKFAKKGKKEGADSEVRVITVNLGDFLNVDEEEESSKDSPRGTGNLFSTLFDQIMNPMTEERKKVQEMETNYEQVWDSGEEETDKRKRV